MSVDHTVLLRGESCHVIKTRHWYQFYPIMYEFVHVQRKLIKWPTLNYAIRIDWSFASTTSIMILWECRLCTDTCVLYVCRMGTLDNCKTLTLIIMHHDIYMCQVCNVYFKISTKLLFLTKNEVLHFTYFFLTNWKTSTCACKLTKDNSSFQFKN